MNMANVFPPFKIDIAGAFCVPRALKDVREQYQNGQVSRQILQAVEDAEVRSLVERLELGGMKVVSDGGFRSRDFLESWEGICSKDGRPFSEGSPLEITGRLSLLRHPILEEFAFLEKTAYPFAGRGYDPDYSTCGADSDRNRLLRHPAFDG